jgi:HD-GYP domain-containing protein (c-di-GMP phosphodiesterase class II)
MTVLDIYQALTEERPYRKPLSHKRTKEIVGKIRDSGELVPDIVSEVGRSLFLALECNL